MADESNVNLETPEPTLPNAQASRTADGTLKDQSQPEPSPPTETKPHEPDPKPAAEPPSKPTAPDSYTFKAPEGRELDRALLDSATPIFRELGLDQANAQKLVDFMTGPFADHTKKLVDTMRADWQSQITKDPIMGGKLDAVKADIGRMKAEIFGNDSAARKDFEDAMNLTGAGDHPDIVRAWWKASQRFTEGTHVSGAGPSKEGQVAPGTNTKPSAAQALWPNLT